MKLGKSLAILLIQKEMSQTELAKKLGVQRQMVGRWCRTGNISTKHVIAICDLFGMMASEFVAIGELADQKTVGRTAITKCKDIINKG